MTKDPAPHQELVDAIRVLRIELRIANDRVAAAAGLNSRDLDVLDVIDREAPCTPRDLVARTGIRAATLTGVLARLESAGWISRATASGDARSVLLRSTDRFDELRRLYARGDGAVRELVGGLTPRTERLVAGFLNDVADAVREAGSELGADPEGTVAGSMA